MIPYYGAILFVIFILILIALIVVFVFYMNKWLCFEKVPHIWCLERNYDRLSSIQTTEDEYEQEEMDSEASEVEKSIADDAVTIADENIGGKGDSSRWNDDNRSDASDELIQKFGLLETKIYFDIMKNTLQIDVVSVKNLPLKKMGGPTMYQLYLKVFSDTGVSMKKWHTPMFKVARNKDNVLQSKFLVDQVCQYTDMSQKIVSTTAVRFRLYGCERKRRTKLLSETTIAVASVNLGSHDIYKIKLEKRGEIKLVSKNEMEMEDGTSYTTAAARQIQIHIVDRVGDFMELLLGLSYNKVTGHLNVEIVKGNALKTPLTREESIPNPFIKITLCAKNSQIIAKSKTTVRPCQANPLFKEKFIFQIPQIQLPEISAIIAVCHKKSLNRKIVIGWFSLGYHNSTSEEKNHWDSMGTSNGDIVYQWHKLMSDSSPRHGLPGAD